MTERAARRPVGACATLSDRETDPQTARPECGGCRLPGTAFQSPPEKRQAGGAL